MANGGDFLGGNEMSFADIGVFVVLDQLSKRARSLYCHLSALHDSFQFHVEKTEWQPKNFDLSQIFIYRLNINITLSTH